MEKLIKFIEETDAFMLGSSYYKVHDYPSSSVVLISNTGKTMLTNKKRFTKDLEE